MNVLFARELGRRLTGTGVVSNAMHPGFVHTNFGPQKGLLRMAMPLARPFMISAPQGADTMVWLASAPEAARVSGEYFYKRRIALSSPRSKDMDLARRLWEISARLVGIA
jgi:NAD(P)-dependent dehydrogenase (short-subunit alcohol dehydrogenase family)